MVLCCVLSAWLVFCFACVSLFAGLVFFCFWLVSFFGESCFVWSVLVAGYWLVSCRLMVLVFCVILWLAYCVCSIGWALGSCFFVCRFFLLGWFCFCVLCLCSRVCGSLWAIFFMVSSLSLWFFLVCVTESGSLFCS